MHWIFFVLGPLGLLPLLIILYKIRKQQKFKKEAVRVFATVLQVFGYSSRNMSRVLIQYPVFGTNETVTREIAVAGMPYKAGDTLPMFYDPADPNKMVLQGSQGAWAIMIIFTTLLAAAIIGAAYMISKEVAAGHM